MLPAEPKPITDNGSLAKALFNIYNSAKMVGFHMFSDSDRSRNYYRTHSEILAAHAVLVLNYYKQSKEHTKFFTEQQHESYEQVACYLRKMIEYAEDAGMYKALYQIHRTQQKAVETEEEFKSKTQHYANLILHALEDRTQQKFIFREDMSFSVQVPSYKL